MIDIKFLQPASVDISFVDLHLKMYILTRMRRFDVSKQHFLHLELNKWFHCVLSNLRFACNLGQFQNKCSTVSCSFVQKVHSAESIYFIVYKKLFVTRYILLYTRNYLLQECDKFFDIEIIVYENILLLKRVIKIFLSIHLNLYRCLTYVLKFEYTPAGRCSVKSLTDTL